MARNDGIDRTVARNQDLETPADVAKVQEHNEREKDSYSNQDIVPERTSLNVHFKAPTDDYVKMFEQMEQDGVISTRGLKPDAVKYGELVFDVNSAYFYNRGGYEFAKQFYADAYKAAAEIVGGEQYILSAVMHADERNRAMSEALGEDVYHYHLHVVYIPVVEKQMLSNPVYTRRVAWGKRRTEKVPGKDNEYRLVKQDEYILSEVISHEAFVSKEDFDKVQEIKAIRGKKGNHNIGQYNAHLLSGIVKCPQCGAPMYIGMTKWTNQDGTERRTESYVCSYATKHRGTSVCRRNGVVASQVEDEVMEYTRKIVRNPQFIKDLQEKVMAAVDMTEVENDITAYKKQQSALQRSRDSLEQDIDRIAPDDKYAERRRADMTRRLNAPYDQNYKAEDLLQESLMKKATLESEQMSVQSMIGILSPFDAIYDRMNAAERRDLVKYLISEVELFPREEQKTQKRFVKAIAYKFPIEQKVLTQFDECGASVETVCLLVK